MATSTLGTAANNTLTAIAFQRAGLLAADIATIKQGILDDQNTSHPIAQNIGTGGYFDNGILYVPNRGYLLVLPGDFVAFDSTTGWPILVSSRAAGAAGWVHNP